MQLRTLQLLLLLGAIAWALAPFWGMALFLAFELLLLITVAYKRRAAGRVVRAHREALEKMLTPEALAWVEARAFHFAWPKVADAYGTTLKMTSLLVLLVGLWLPVRALLFLSPQVLWGLGPAVAVFFVGVLVGSRIDAPSLLEQDGWKKFQPAHDEATKVVRLLETAGRWVQNPPP